MNLTYLLPKSADKAIPTILDKLTANQHRLRFKSFGIMGRTLEEVFQKVESETPKQVLVRPEHSLLGKVEMLTGKELSSSRLHALAFRRICNFKPNKFVIATMIWALLFFAIIKGFYFVRNESEAWVDTNKNLRFQNHEIHAYLETSAPGDTHELFKNFSIGFTKTISTNLKMLCQDCSLTLQSREAFFGSMPYSVNMKFPRQYLVKDIKEQYSYVAFSYDSPVTKTKSTMAVDDRILERINNKQMKSLTVYFTMQVQHLSYRALNLAHNFILL